MIELKYFKPSEFFGWFEKMNETLLINLDYVRDRMAKIFPHFKIKISPASGAVGRELKDSNSRHNITKWGEVQAVDIMPYILTTEGDRPLNRLEACVFTGLLFSKFSGVGIYPFWRPMPGFHIDIRPEALQDVKKWADISRGSHNYVEFSLGLKSWIEKPE